jgi:hypothetical protein
VVHQMVQRNVRIEAGHARHGGQREAGKCRQWILFVAKAGEHQIEPDHVGLAVANGFQQSYMVAQAVFFPTALHVEVRQLRFTS